MEKTTRASEAIEFFSADFVWLRGPIVYIIVWILGPGGHVPVYVGMSSRGLTRPFDKKHHVLKYLTDEPGAYRVRVFPATTIEEAKELEQVLIKTLQPKWNTMFIDTKKNLSLEIQADLLALLPRPRRIESPQRAQKNRELRAVPASQRRHENNSGQEDDKSHAILS